MSTATIYAYIVDLLKYFIFSLNYYISSLFYSFFWLITKFLATLIGDDPYLLAAEVFIKYIGLPVNKNSKEVSNIQRQVQYKTFKFGKHTLKFPYFSSENFNLFTRLYLKFLANIPIIDYYRKWDDTEAKKFYQSLNMNPYDQHFTDDDQLLLKFCRDGPGYFLISKHNEGYVIDLSRLERYSVRKGFEPYGIKIFFDNNMTKILYMERFGKQYSPDDSYINECAESTLIMYITIVHHALFVHFILGNRMALVANNTWKSNNTLSAFLNLFTSFNTYINLHSYETLVDSKGKGLFERTNAFAEGVLFQLMDDEISSFKFITDKDFIVPNSMLTDISNRYWVTISSYVDKIMNKLDIYPYIQKEFETSLPLKTILTSYLYSDIFTHQNLNQLKPFIFPKNRFKPVIDNRVNLTVYEFNNLIIKFADFGMPQFFDNYHDYFINPDDKKMYYEFIEEMHDVDIKMKKKYPYYTRFDLNELYLSISH